jgi:outer membrane receptor for ferrienterochelin and colicins
MTKTHLLAGVAASLTLAAALPAAAQSVDYGSLQELFGEAVTTSATGSPQRSTEAPADMQIISADEIRRSGETSLPGILQRVAGVDVLNASAGQADVNVRGYNQIASPRLLVLVNGRQVYQDHYGLTIWAAIPVQLSEIRQIEVVKGPGSALFGFNAVSGVVNIITYNPKFDAANSVKAYAGTGGASGGSLVLTQKFGDKVSARLSIGANRADEWATRTTILPAALKHDPRSVSSNLDVVAQIAPKTELRVEGSWSNMQETALASHIAYGVIKDVSSAVKATVTSDTRFGLIQAQAYQNQLTAKYNLSTLINWKNKITVASVQDLFKVGTAHTFRVGGEFRHNSLNAAPYGPAEVSYDVAALSGMWNWQINDQLTTTAAVRVDKMSLDRSGVFLPRQPLADNRLWNRDISANSANVTAAWRPTSADTFRLSYGRGIQAPSLVELGGLQVAVNAAPGFTIDLIGNPLLKPTVVTNTELAYDHDFAPVKAKLGVRLFAQDWKDLKSALSGSSLSIMPTATTNGAATYANVADSKLKGAEFVASGRITDALGWRADYTGRRSRTRPSRGSIRSAPTPPSISPRPRAAATSASTMRRAPGRPTPICISSATMSSTTSATAP